MFPQITKNDLFHHKKKSKMLSLSTLLKSGFTPTLQDCNNFFLFLFCNQRFKAIIHIFSQLSSNKINVDAQTNTVFTKALLKENKYEEAAEFLKTIVGNFSIFQKNRLLDSLIQGLSTINQEPDKGLLLLKDFLNSDGVYPSSRTFCSLIYGFSRIGKMDKVIDLLELMSDDKFKYPFDNYVCSSVISGFVRIGEPELAIGFYDNAVKSGSLKPNVVTCTSLVTAYCKLRNVDKVSDLVAWMEKNELGFDVLFYSNWMYGCFRDGLLDEAFQKYRTMADKKIELDNISYTILIDGFSKDGNVEKAVGFLYKMRRDGLEPNLVTYTAIILAYCKKGKLDEAFAIFSMFESLGIEADEFTYAILIDGVCRKGDFDIAFHLLDEMDKRGVSPSVVTYNTVINGLSKFGRTSEADEFSKGMNGDVFTYSSLLRGYVEEHNRSGILKTKRRIEEACIRMDVVLANILIKALLMVGLLEDAFEICKGLTRMDSSANSVTFCTLIDGFFKAGRVEEALEIFDEFRKTPNSSGACHKRIVLGLCQNGMVDMAVDVFIEYIDKGFPLDRKIYMTLIEGVFSRKGAEGVLKTIRKMREREFNTLDVICNDAIFFLCRMGFPEASYGALLATGRKELASPSICYYSILNTLLLEGKKTLARLIITSFLKLYGTSGLGVCKIIVNYLCLHDVRKALLFLPTMKPSITVPIAFFKKLINDDKVLDAYELLTGTENMNAFYYSIVIDALCKSRRTKMALDLCGLAKKKMIDLNIVTYNIVINGLCMQGCLVEAFRLFDSLERINLLPTEVTYGTLIDVLVKEGLLRDGRLLFERMFVKDLRPGPRIYNSLINGYCKANLLEEGIKLFQDMVARNIEPDGFTVSALINGYCRKADMEGALKIFFEFKSDGLSPDFLGFMYLIRGLCAKGRMEESRSVLREMLKTQSVVDILNRVKNEDESDSVDKIVISLCERGCINEAVNILNDFVSVFFKKSSCYALRNYCYDSASSEDFDEDGRERKSTDFDSFYSRVRSLCMKGELAEANKLAKLLMEL